VFFYCSVRSKSQEELSQKNIKIENDLPNKLRNLMKRYDQRLSVDNLRLVECYIEMEIHLLLQFRMRDGSEFVACFQRDGRIDSKEVSAKVGNGVSGRLPTNTLVGLDLSLGVMLRAM
jgi:hypothetical protein